MRVYRDELSAGEPGLQGEIDITDATSLIVAVAMPEWPTMSTAGPGTVYTINLETSAAETTETEAETQASETEADPEPTDPDATEASETEFAIQPALNEAPVEGEDFKWMKQIGSDWTNAPSEGALADGKLYTMSGNALIALDATTGEETGRATMAGTPSWGISAPVVSDGIIVALDGGTVEAFSTDLESQWTYTSALGGQAVAPLAVTDGVIVTGFWNGEGLEAELVALERETGELLWSVTSNGYYGAGALIHEGRVYIGGDIVGDTSQLTVYDLRDGTVLDELDVEGHIRSSIVRADDKLYFTSKDGFLHEVALGDGLFGEARSLALPGPSTSTPAISEGRLYVGSANPEDEFGAGRINTIDLESFSLDYSIEVPGPVAATPVAAGDTVYFTVNALPGGIYQLTDAGSSGDVTTFFTPPAEQQNYVLSTPILDDVLYYHNDSGSWFAVPVAASTNNVTIWIIAGVAVLLLILIVVLVRRRS